MMHLVLIRHGEPDYSFVTERKFIGHGRSLAQLTTLGMEQAHHVSQDIRLKDAELIVSSPYTRALQTAAILSKNTGLDIKIEIDLHEWLPDTTYRYDSDEYSRNASKECTYYKGKQNPQTKYHWEDLSNVAKRAFACLQKYEAYSKIVVVTHGIVMRQFVFAEHIPYCGILETEFDHSFEWKGFIER